MFFNERFQFESDEFVQTHVKDRVGLRLRKGKLRRHYLRFYASELDPAGLTVYKAVLNSLSVSCAPEDLDDQVYDVDRFDKTFLDLPLFALFFKKILILSRGRLVKKVRIGFQDLPKAQCLGPSVPDREHIYAKGVFQPRLFIEKIPEIVDIRIFLQFNDYTDPFFVGLVRNVDDIVRDLFLGERSNIREELAEITRLTCPERPFSTMVRPLRRTFPTPVS